jgi:hypothetical protein
MTATDEIFLVWQILNLIVFLCGGRVNETCRPKAGLRLF